jgi:hypothetical protein
MLNREFLKKRLIDAVLTGSNVYTKTIEKYNIIWQDILDCNADTTSVKRDIKDYLEKRTRKETPKVYSIDILRFIGEEKYTHDEEAFQKRLKDLKKFFKKHFETLKDTRFDTRYTSTDIDAEYLRAADLMVLDYYKLREKNYY